MATSGNASAERVGRLIGQMRARAARLDHASRVPTPERPVLLDISTPRLSPAESAEAEEKGAQVFARHQAVVLRKVTNAAKAKAETKAAMDRRLQQERTDAGRRRVEGPDPALKRAWVHCHQTLPKPVCKTSARHKKARHKSPEKKPPAQVRAEERAMSGWDIFSRFPSERASSSKGV